MNKLLIIGVVLMMASLVCMCYCLYNVLLLYKRCEYTDEQYKLLELAYRLYLIFLVLGTGAVVLS